MLSEFERKIWRVQGANLHSEARTLSSPNLCFWLSRNLGKDFFRYLWYCGKKTNRKWFSVALVKFHYFGIIILIDMFLTNLNVACILLLLFRKSRNKPNLERTSKYVFRPIWKEKNGRVLSMRMQVFLDSPFAHPDSAPIGGGKKEEFRDWTR